MKRNYVWVIEWEIDRDRWIPRTELTYDTKRDGTFHVRRIRSFVKNGKYRLRKYSSEGE